MGFLGSVFSFLFDKSAIVKIVMAIVRLRVYRIVDDIEGLTDEEKREVKNAIIVGLNDSEDEALNTV